MSKPKILALVLTFLMITGGVGLSLWQSETIPSSQTELLSKNEQLDPQKRNFHHTAKLTVPVEAQFNMPTENPKAGEPIELEILLYNQAGPAIYDFEIVPGPYIKIQKGSLDGQLDFRETRELKLTYQFSQDVEQDQRINFFIYDTKQGQSRHFQVSTIRFHERQAEMRALLERQDAYHKEIGLDPASIKKSESGHSH
jgi:hypothetical protein